MNAQLTPMHCAAAGLALNVLTDAVNPTNGSYYNAGGTGPAEAVQGSIQASFVGGSAVDGIVGAFDVTAGGDAAALPAVPPTDSVNGVFIMAVNPEIIITAQ